MENKYYTPSEQELIEHIINGESVYFKAYGDSTLVEIVPSGSIYNLIEFLNQNGCVLDGKPYDLDESYYQLKYLDRSDIELLGWEFLAKYSGEDKNVISFQKDNRVLVYNFETKKIFIFIKDYSKEPGVLGSTKDIKISGLEVKNISELKKLMKQLKIGEDEK